MRGVTCLKHDPPEVYRLKLGHHARDAAKHAQHGEQCRIGCRHLSFRESGCELVWRLLMCALGSLMPPDLVHTPYIIHTWFPMGLRIPLDTSGVNLDMF